MPNYSYTSKSLDGQTHSGVLNAKDERQLAQDLRGQGMILIKASPEGERVKFNFNMSFSFFKVSLVEKIMMVRNLGVMFSAGLSLVKSFEILAIQAKTPQLKKVFLDIKEKINKGENFSSALEGYPNIFSDLFVSMIKVGEESGTLDDIFQILSLQLKKENELKSKIKNAMVYPAIIVMVMIVVGIVMITFVFPSLKVFFSTLNADIPIYTKIMLSLSDYLSVNWYLLIVGPLAAFFLFFLTLKTKRGRDTLDTLLLRTPLISQIVKKNNSAFLIRSLSSLIVSGVPLIRSLEITSSTVNNHYFKEALTEASEKIKKGEKLSNALKLHQNLFPVGVIEMIEVGEETGKTSDILKKLAEFYEQEAANEIERLMVLIEPILIIFLGLAVALFAFSVIQPMYSSLKSIG